MYKILKNCILFSSITTLSNLLQSRLSPPYISLTSCGMQVAALALVPQGWVKPSTRRVLALLAVSCSGKQSTAAGTEQDLEVIDGLLVFHCFGVSFLFSAQLFFPCCHLSSKFVCPIFPFRPIFFLLLTFSSQAFSAFQLLPAIQPSVLWHLCSHHSFFNGECPKITWK